MKKHPTYTVNGYVQDYRTGEKLIGATVLFSCTTVGTTTNQFGFFSLTLPRDTTSLQVSYIGYEISRLPVKKVEKATIHRSPATQVQPAGGGHYRYAPPAQEPIAMSRVNVSPADVKSMPRLLGEADIMRHDRRFARCIRWHRWWRLIKCKRW